MPLPVYLICSESGAVDDTTKLASYFNLVEKLQVVTLQLAPGQIAVVQASPLRLSAYWMKEEGDSPETVFEVQFVATLPSGPSEIQLARTETRFDGPFRRINITGVMFQNLTPGLLRIEARM